MPNWCENRVSIYCDQPEILKQFVDECMTDGVFDFYKILPLNLGNNEDGSPTWDYTTACNKWGTKWPIGAEDGTHFDITENHIDANFDTAWGPPEGIYRAIDSWFEQRDADFSISWFYDEPGMQFAGYLNNE